MSDPDPNRAKLRRMALSRWDNEGGALAPASHESLADAHQLSNAELIHLRIRMIALENMMIAVLAEGSDRQLEVAREMAAYIAPRPGFAQHPLTVQAADHMTDLVERAIHFRTVPPE
jgi:hypothetical protein